MDPGCTVTDGGAPALVFVHGYACAREDWALQVAALAPRWRCLTLDLPGHGAAPLGGQRSMEQLAEHVNAIRRRLAPGPVVLVGHSLGVRIVIDACLAQPQDVAGLVFVDGRFYDGDPAQVAARMTALVDGPGFDGFIRRAFGGMFTPDSDPGLRERIVERAARLDPDFGRALFLESVLWDSTRGRDALRRIPVPVLHLQSTDVDAERRMISLQPGMRTHFMATVEALVADATVRVVPGVGHFAMLEAPEAVNAEIEDFVQRLAR